MGSNSQPQYSAGKVYAGLAASLVANAVAPASVEGHTTAVG